MDAASGLSLTPLFMNSCLAAAGQAILTTSCAIHAGVAFGEVCAGSSGELVLDGDFMVQGAAVVVSQGSIVQVGTACVFDSDVAGIVIGQDDNHIAATAAGGLEQLKVITFFYGTHALWGAGNTDVGVAINPLAALAYESNVPTITGSNGDFSLGFASTGRAWDESGGAYTSAISCTWTNVALGIGSGGFGDDAHNVAKDARVVKIGA